ncbi:hypothetical protein ADUPG1_002458, partial [Aduncisulcus paluster]
VKEGETTNDLYAFLTTEPNAEIGAVYPKAMPVILTTPEELQRPLPDATLRIVARGVKEDPPGSAAARGTGCSDEIGREGYPKGRGAAGGSESEASRARFRRSRMEE